MGTLYVVSTPIGNLEDITIRAIKTLFSADILACEDTRRTGLLLSELKKRYFSFFQSSHLPVIQSLLVPYHDHNEAKVVPQLIGYLEQSKSVALISDAGTPLMNDPGFLLVRECRKRNISVVSIPGASAVLTALTASGLPANTFTYLGYPPQKQGHRVALFHNLLSMNRFIDSTYIFFCAPHKLEQTLLDMKEVFGDIEITIARELTKIHEEIWRGAISQYTKEKIKGELVILFNL